MKLAREVIHQDEEVLVATVMAPDGDCYDDLRPIFKEIAVLPEQTHSLNIGILEGGGESSGKIFEDAVSEEAAPEDIIFDEAGSEDVIFANKGSEYAVFEDTDGLISLGRGATVGVVTADCVPILLYAPDLRAVAAIHAGWKGTLGGIVERALDILEEKGADMSGLKVWFGPSISKEMYEVDEGLAEKFREAGFEDYVSRMDDRPHIDLQGVNTERFMRRGVKSDNLHLHQGCSFTSKYHDGRPKYQSHRRSRGKAGRMLSYIQVAT